MFTYRVTKYDPRLRDAAGASVSDDWTSASDIGKSFDGRTLTKKEYLEVEDRYVDAVERLLSSSGIGSIWIRDLEVKARNEDVQFDDDAVAMQCAQLCNGTLVAGTSLQTVIRGCLREYVWCRLSGPRHSYVHFGYDYYMYVGLPNSASNVTLPQGIFLEELESPYMANED